MARWCVGLAGLALVLVLAGAPAQAMMAEDGTVDDSPLGPIKNKIMLDLYEDAIKDLEAYVAENPTDPEAYNLLGFASRNLGEYDAAMEYYDMALELDNTLVTAIEYYGVLWLELGRVDDAKAMLARLDELCPDGCEERDMLAEALDSYESGTVVP